MFIPYEYFEYLGIDFLPDKYWLIAIPTHFFVTLIYIVVFYKGLCKIITKSTLAKNGIISINFLIRSTL